jgi:hypothetical protein
MWIYVWYIEWSSEKKNDENKAEENRKEGNFTLKITVF